MPQRTSCTGTRADGAPCGSTVVLASGLCFIHDPDRAAERSAARVKGGRGKSRLARVGKLLPSAMRPALARLFSALGEVHRGELDPRQASAMAALAGAIARLYQAGELEERVRQLEAAPPAEERRA